MEAVHTLSDIDILTRPDDIRRWQQKFTVYGLAIATAIELFVLGTYYGVQRWGANDDSAPTVRLRILKYSELGPPPSLTNTEALPTVAVSSSSFKPSIGIPVPVPDAQVNPEQTIASQQELNAVQSPIGDKEGSGNSQVTQDIRIDDEPDMNAFIPIEKEPQIVRAGEPKYPEVARMAGIDGIVWVKILVGKDGKPKKAVVIKEIPRDVFAQSAVEAAMKYVFTPALMNSGPVQVWTVIRFKFQLSAKPVS